MDREDALEELGERYRIRILVSLEHQGDVVQLHASTLVEHQDEIGAGLTGLVDLVVPRLTAALETHPEEASDGKASGRQGGEGAA